ncbi:MAG: TROVE domain-containing protein, partial [Bacteroidota bacterium]|nr:TROVE domain-containing protein [Bacteroidota bacterium]
QYRKMAPAAKLYLFDLAGLGQSPLEILKDDVYLIAGWSDKIFDVLAAIENGSDAIELINQIDI